jgi:hypothetical protein
MSEDRKWPFSFENVCEILKLDIDYVRHGLIRWGEREDELRRRGKVLAFKAPTPFAAADAPAAPAARAS